jgi:hypothetical protein
MLSTIILAQNNSTPSTITIKGSVQDVDTRQPLEGVSISDAKKITLAVTKEDGSFSVSVPAGTLLSFSTVSFTSNTFTASKNETGIVISLKNEAKTLDNVVVTTALGISRQQKALGYAIQTLDSSDLTDARPNNWASALAGKVAGLSLLSAGSGPLSSTKITLRGNGSMDPNGNNALIVLDGVPMNNQGSTSGVGNAYGAGSGNDVPIDF